MSLAHFVVAVLLAFSGSSAAEGRAGEGPKPSWPTRDCPRTETPGPIRYLLELGTYCLTGWVRKYLAAGAGFYAALSEGVTVASLEIGAEGDRPSWRPFVLWAAVTKQLRVTVAAAAPGLHGSGGLVDDLRLVER